MKPSLATLGLALTLFLTPVSHAQVIQTDALDLITANSITSTVNVLMGKIGRYGSCSGVVIKNTPDESVVLTAKHCISFEGEMYVDSLMVDDIKVAFKSDLAYLITYDFIPNKSPATLSNYTPHRGDNIIGIGYPGRKLYITKGTIFTQSPSEQLVNLKIIKGCSGGGVYNEKGELIGIMTRYFPGINIAILVRLEDIHTFLNVNQILE